MSDLETSLLGEKLGFAPDASRDDIEEACFVKYQESGSGLSYADFIQEVFDARDLTRGEIDILRDKIDLSADTSSQEVRDAVLRKQTPQGSVFNFAEHQYYLFILCSKSTFCG